MMINKDNNDLQLGDVDSADNEEETDSELHVPPKPEVHTPTCKSNSNHNLQASLSCGVLRSNQLVRTKVKHETKL